MNFGTQVYIIELRTLVGSEQPKHIIMVGPEAQISVSSFFLKTALTILLNFGKYKIQDMNNF